MANLDETHKSHEMGLHSEQLTGRTQQTFFLPEEEENFVYPGSFDVDFDKREEFDVQDIQNIQYTDDPYEIPRGFRGRLQAVRRQG